MILRPQRPRSSWSAPDETSNPLDKGTKALSFICSCHVGLSKRFSCSISLQSIVSIHIFLADYISCTSCVGSVYRMLSLAVVLLVYEFSDRKSSQIPYAAFIMWLEIVSSTYIWMGRYNHSLSFDAALMVSENCPAIVGIF